jgi:hypothetical protein
VLNLKKKNNFIVCKIVEMRKSKLNKRKHDNSFLSFFKHCGVSVLGEFCLYILFKFFFQQFSFTMKYFSLKCYFVDISVSKFKGKENYIKTTNKREKDWLVGFNLKKLSKCFY